MTWLKEMLDDHIEVLKQEIRDLLHDIAVDIFNYEVSSHL